MILASWPRCIPILNQSETLVELNKFCPLSTTAFPLIVSCSSVFFCLLVGWFLFFFMTWLLFLSTLLKEWTKPYTPFRRPLSGPNIVWDTRNCQEHVSATYTVLLVIRRWLSHGKCMISVTENSTDWCYSSTKQVESSFIRNMKGVFLCKKKKMKRSNVTH